MRSRRRQTILEVQTSSRTWGFDLARDEISWTSVQPKPVHRTAVEQIKTELNSTIRSILQSSFHFIRPIGLRSWSRFYRTEESVPLCRRRLFSVFETPFFALSCKWPSGQTTQFVALRLTKINCKYGGWNDTVWNRVSILPKFLQKKNRAVTSRRQPEFEQLADLRFNAFNCVSCERSRNTKD